MLSNKVYIVTDPFLTQVALRSKNLDFTPFVVEFAERMLEVSESGMMILKKKSDTKNEAYMDHVNTITRSTLQPGVALLEMNVRVLGMLADFVNGIGADWQSKPLYSWLTETFTLASSRALYGQNDPFNSDRSLLQSLW